MCKIPMALIIFLFLAFIASHSSLRNVTLSFNSSETSDCIYIRNLLGIYKGFQFIIDVDNNTLELAEAFIYHIEVNLSASLTIFNYDSVNKKFLRPNGKNFVNLVVLGKFTRFNFFTQITLNIILYDVVIFLVDDWRVGDQRGKKKFKWDSYDLGPPFWQLLDLKYAGRVIFIATARNSLVSVYSKCYYCGKQERYLRLQEQTTAAMMNISLKELMPSSFDNLEGYYFAVSFLDYFPFIYCKEVREKTVRREIVKVCTRSYGAEAKLLKTLSSALNFKYNLISEGNMYNASYTFIFNKVRDKKIDFMVGGITLTKLRASQATFTKPLRFEDYVLFYMLRQSLWQRSFVLIYPFNGRLWIVCLVALAVVTASFFLFMKFNNFFFKTKSTAFAECICITVCSILEQPIQHPNRIRTRLSHYILLIILWFTCIEIDTLYKGKLASVLVSPKNHEPETISELFQEGFGFVTDSLKEDAIWEILDPNDPLIQEAKRHTVEVINVCAVLDYMLHHKCSMLTEISVAMYSVQYVCEESFNTNYYNVEDLRIASNALRTTHHAWALQRGVPYWISFNKIINHLQSGGFLNKWEKDSLSELRNYKEIQRSNKVDRYRSVYTSLLSYFSPFLIYVLGNTVAFICFVAEILIYRLKYS